MRGWALSPYFSASMAFHLNLFLQTNNILLITWGHIMSQDMLKFLIIGPKNLLALTPSSKASLNLQIQSPSAH